MITENSISHILRWIVFAPVAVVGAWILWFIAHNIILFSAPLLPYSYDLFGYSIIVESYLRDFFPQLGSNVFASLMSGYFFVLIGAKIAPYDQKKIAYMLLSLGLVFNAYLTVSFALLLMDTYGTDYTIFDPDYWSVLGFISQTTGMVFSTYEIHQNDVFSEEP